MVKAERLRIRAPHSNPQTHSRDEPGDSLVAVMMPPPDGDTRPGPCRRQTRLSGYFVPWQTPRFGE